MSTRMWYLKKKHSDCSNIYGRKKFVIEGKYTQRKLHPFEEEFCGEVPKHLIKEYSEVTLFIDIMYVNGLAFMVLTTEHLGFIQCLCIRTAHEEQIVGTLKNFASTYKLRGFKARTVHSDRQFKCC